MDLKTLDDLPLVAFPGNDYGGQDPYKMLVDLRAQSPLARTEVGFVLALRHRHLDIVTGDLTRQIETESKMIQGIVSGPIFDLVNLAMLFANGDTHRRRRAPVSRTFAFKLMDDMRPRIVEIATEMIEDRLDGRPFDFVDEIASQLPARIIAEILGIPRADLPTFLQWIQDTAAALGFIDMDERERIESSLTAFNAYVGDLLEDRRTSKGDGFLSSYVEATAASGELSEGEIRTQILGLILAGSDTTRGSMSMTLSEMLQHPAQWSDFVADPDGLKRQVVQEGLRYQPVVSAIPRVALKDFELDGVAIPQGAVIAVSLVSVLRDPDVFEDAETFNIHRTDHPKWHPVFGAGAHRCLGEALARAEMEETLATIARLAPNTELVGAPPKLQPGAIRPIGAMAVAFRTSSNPLH
ncbi:MAG: cytochrome P450 [Pseudomonadota bacterium]